MTVNKKDFGAFELHERIGSGGMASVYLGVQKSLDRKVVLKILFPHLAEDAQLVERFEREARAAALLKHENIVQVIDCGRQDDVPYIAMEFVEGMDLEKWLASWGVPPLEIGLLMLREIFAGLEHAHLHRIVHRDIKPANVMFTADGNLKIMDFGLARRDSDSKGLTVVGSVLGTPAYMSPEQATGAEVDERGDVFSAGVMAYQLLSGVRPFEGASYSVILNSILTAEPKPLNEVNPLVPAGAAAMVRKMIQKEPADRFQTSAELRTELENVVEAMGLQRHREMLRQYARDPKTIGDILRDKRLTRHFEEGVRLEGEGPGMSEAAQLEFRRVLYLDPNHRAALDHLKKLDRETAKLESASVKGASASPAVSQAAAPAPPAAPPAPAPAKPAASAAPPAPKPQTKAPPRPTAKPAPAPKPPKPAGAKTALPLPLILLGVIGVLVVLLVVRLLMSRSGGTGSPAPATAPPVVAIPNVRPSAPPEAQVPMPSPSPVPPPAQAPAPQPSVTAPAPVALKPAPAIVSPPAISEPPATHAPGATASIKVSTEPTGATVTIDGERQKRTTNAVFPVTPGSHKLVIEKPGYYPQDMTVNDLKKDETRPAGLSLKALPAGVAGGDGTMEIHIVPASKIFVNDAMVSGEATETTLRLPAGAYTIRAVNATYGSQEWRRDIKAGTPVKIDYDFEAAARAAAEAPTLGKLRVTSQGPAGAQVWVDGVNTGLVTPCTVERLKAGPHTVNLVLEGYAPERENQSVTVKAGGTADLKIKLKKRR